ncbi:hypothetical protein FRC08_014136 [Ceratobasidium sp. 394]|nr:hypothetical protein FRC08_014136 [Ceratobasidium sp. 394]
MPPEREHGMKATLRRVERGLRRLFQNYDKEPPETGPNPELDTQLSRTDWYGLERLRTMLVGKADTFGPLATTIDQLSRCIGLFENRARARDEYKKLGIDLNDLLHALADHFEADSTSITLDSIGKFVRSVEDETKLLKSTETSEPKTDGGAAEGVDNVLGCYRRLRTILALFMLSESTKIWNMNDEILDTRLEHLPHSPEAHYSACGSGNLRRTGCMPDTRRGKTTIAYSLCEHLENSGRPAASFFCDRYSPNCQGVKRIFPSVAYQLARRSRSFRYAISSALEQDHNIYNHSVDKQFKRLIATPLGSVGHTFGVDVVVVLDGLEECEGEDGVNRILGVCFKDSLDFPLRFLISSHPNPIISHRVQASPSGGRRAELQLYAVDHTLAQEDVKIYLKAKLEHLSLPDDEIGWPAQRLRGWFFYAVSALRSIELDKVSGRAERLKRLLDVSSRTANADNRDMDGLYIQILTEAVHRNTLSDSRRAEVMHVFGTAAWVQELLTMSVVAGLLRLDFDLVHTALRPLLPVLHCRTTVN